MTPREALDQVERWLVDDENGTGPIAPPADAVAELARWARTVLRPMPHAITGRTVEHAAHVVETDAGERRIETLCGSLKPATATTDDVLDGLPSFDPEDGTACRRCVRELPDDLRPPAPPSGRRQRPPLDLSTVEVAAHTSDGPMILADNGRTIDAWSPSIDLATMVQSAKEYLRQRE